MLSSSNAGSPTNSWCCRIAPTYRSMPYGYRPAFSRPNRCLSSIHSSSTSSARRGHGHEPQGDSVQLDYVWQAPAHRRPDLLLHLTSLLQVVPGKWGRLRPRPPQSQVSQVFDARDCRQPRRGALRAHPLSPRFLHIQVAHIQQHPVTQHVQCVQIAIRPMNKFMCP